jgi:threonine dehydrogenase-like Zn-dependent dehydrogenase
MKAAVYHGRGDVRVQERDEPGMPSAHEVRLRVLRAAICGTDVSEFTHGPHLIPLGATHPGSGHRGPVVLGHEFVGVIDAVGREVDGLTPGQRVVPGAGMWCGACRWCATGRTNLCERYYTLGLQADGGLTEYVNVPERMCRVVPDYCSDDAAAIAQPFAVALHGLRRGGIGAGDTVALIGVGGIGFFLLAGAVARGAGRVVAIDIDDERLSTATAFGASHVLHPVRDDVRSVIRELTDGAGADVVIEASGAPSGPALAQRLVRRGGSILLLGLQAEPRALDLADLTVREVDVLATNAHVCDVDLPEALEVLQDERVAAAAIDRVVPLEAFVEEGLAPAARGGLSGKVLVQPGGPGAELAG